MALMNLLTLGRSLSEARERPHRYKLMHGALPTFGNPTAPGKRNFEMAAAPKSECEGSQAETRSETMKTECAAAAAEQETEKTVPAGPWMRRANPFKPRSQTPPSAVQGELSLDKVKPLRNDLSDCDLELVPQQPTEANAVQIGEHTVPVVKGQGLWERVRSLVRRKQ